MQIYEKLHNVLNKRLLLPVTLHNQLRHVSPGILWSNKQNARPDKEHGHARNTNLKAKKAGKYMKVQGLSGKQPRFFSTFPFFIFGGLYLEATSYNTVNPCLNESARGTQTTRR